MGYKIVQFYKGPLGPEIKFRFYDYENETILLCRCEDRVFKDVFLLREGNGPLGPRAELLSSIRVLQTIEKRIHSHKGSNFTCCNLDIKTYNY